jgi:hypothetical protein
MPWPPPAVPTGFGNDVLRYGVFVPPGSPSFRDDFDRLDGVLGPNWFIPLHLPHDTQAGSISISDEAVICIDDFTGPPTHTWGYAQAVPEYVGAHTIALEISNVFQGGPGVNQDITPQVELYCHRNLGDASCNVFYCVFYPNATYTAGYVTWGLFDYDAFGNTVDPGIGGTSPEKPLDPSTSFVLRFDVNALGLARAFIDGVQVGGGPLTTWDGTFLGFALSWYKSP